MANKPKFESVLPKLACPVCKKTGMLVLDGKVKYTDPLIYEVRCTACQSKGDAGFTTIARNATFVEMPLIQRGSSDQ